MSETMELPAAKKCTKCGKVKSLVDFGKNKNCADGATYQCSECLKAQNELKKAERESIRFEYYRKFPDKTAEACRRQREERRKHKNTLSKAASLRRKAMREFFKMHRAMHAIAETLNQMKP